MARLLIADDAQQIVDVLRIGLSRAGYEITTASDGREALTILLSEPIDAAIIDVRMPEYDGVTVVRQYRATANVRQIPIILLTADITNEQMKEGITAGANAYIIKPFQIAAITKQINVLLSSEVTKGSNKGGG